MPIGPRSQLEKLLLLQQEMEKLFNDLVRPADSMTQEGFFLPPMDQYENAESYYYELDLPGVLPENLKVIYASGKIVVEGEKMNAVAESNGKYLCAERSFGAFRRVIEVHDGCNTSEIHATFADGVLQLIIPKQAQCYLEGKPIEIECK